MVVHNLFKHLVNRGSLKFTHTIDDYLTHIVSACHRIIFTKIVYYTKQLIGNSSMCAETYGLLVFYFTQIVLVRSWFNAFHILRISVKD